MKKTTLSKRKKPVSQPEMLTPWNSIAESIVCDDVKEKNLKEAMESPCLSCDTAPCCTHLPVNTFKITSILELDYARHLLNFERIELGLSANGDWSSYYCYPCRMMDRSSYGCTVHDRPDQPQICVSYNPFHCWYKRNLTRSMTEDFIRIDRLRLERILDFLRFDNDGNLVKIPDWQTIVMCVEKIPLKPGEPPEEVTPEDTMVDAWREQVIRSEQDDGPSDRYDIHSLKDPCTNCEAYCCRNLVFTQTKPTSYSNLDYYRFALAFPGVSLGISDESWSLVVNTTCRYLDNGRCMVYGDSERPLSCRYLDQWKCDYRKRLGHPRPDGFLKVNFDYFQPVLECFQFDSSGTITRFPSSLDIRNRIENSWRHPTAAASKK